MTSFDNIAIEYCSSTPALPEVFTQFIINKFNVQSDDKIIELGCGTGDIALALADRSLYVTGIDISTAMLDLAKSKDSDGKVRWLKTSASDYDFGMEKNKLVISFDSFHLFPERIKIIGNASKSLIKGGFFAVGWAMYEWDIQLKEVIHNVFSKYHIKRPAWGLWTNPNLANEISSSKARLSKPILNEFTVPAITPVSMIAEYILNNSKSIHLGSLEKQKIKADLIKEILRIFPEGESKGHSTYSILYSEKY